MYVSSAKRFQELRLHCPHRGPSSATSSHGDRVAAPWPTLIFDYPRAEAVADYLAAGEAGRWDSVSQADRIGGFSWG
ncbi:hypothetical protein GCM10018952_48200 [Streptosporangium vulgare]